ncbi:MAG TPA: PKD domain-containing protein, partial [Anaerolineales bacterium]|nr:PKD domain-containing protein [Anaerolineales bacterium]
LLTDPIDSGNSGIPHLPRPRFAYFDHEPAGTINLYIGTQGRGVWRFSIVPPVANAGGPYVTDEGVEITLNGTSDQGGSVFDWDLDNDGDFDDATGPNPVFDMVGQDGVFPIALKVTAGGVFDIDTTTVTVNNVAPAVSLASDAPVNEGLPVTVSGIVTDPGWLDPLTATIDWGDGSPVEAISGTLENTRPDATLTFSTSHVYGDNGNFTAEVCGSDDDTTTCSTIALQVDNVNPTAEIDQAGTVLINGTPTFLAHAGDPLNFSGRATDPGSDDLFLSWDWDDGSPSPDVTTTYLVNPPNADPFPSPSVQPRDVTDTQTHAFAQACLYEIIFSALDDDGGSASDTAIVLIAGNAGRSRSSGYWQHQFGRQGNTDFDNATLECYLAIINNVSTVFSEARNASTIPAAHDVLFLKQNGGSEIEKLDRELMTAWLNFANGAFEYDQMFDPDRDGVFTSFADIMAVAESVRLAPNSTNAQIREQRNILQQLK